MTQTHYNESKKVNKPLLFTRRILKFFNRSNFNGKFLNEKKKTKDDTDDEFAKNEIKHSYIK